MGLFQHWVMVGGSSPEADRLGLRLSEEETKHGVFCRPGCLDGRDAPVCRDPKRRCYARGKGAVYSCQHCGRTGSSSGLPEDPVRNGPDGADALSRFEPAWITRRLRREPAGLSGAEVAGNAQDRPQRCPRLGASRPYRLLQTRLREVAAGARCPLADYRPQEAGRPAGHSREPDPRPCRGVRRPAAPCAEPSLYQAGAAGQRGHRRPVCCDAGAGRAAVLAAVVAIDGDIRKMVRASGACRRLMSIPGVGQLTALAFTAAVDDPGRFRRSRDIGVYLGLVPRRYQSGEVDYMGGISKCGDRRVRTLLYEAANVMLTRYKGPLKLKAWALAIARRSTMRKARIALARRLAILMHAMLRHGTEFRPA